MRVLLKQKISIFLMLTVFIVTASSVLLSSAVFRREIDKLYKGDYSERIRNIEFEYQNVDGITAASDQVSEIQKEVIANLKRKYVSIEGLTAYPYIINGDKELILYLRIDNMDFPENIIEAMIGQEYGDFEFSYDGKMYWTEFSYYKDWDWYTGYIIPNTKRFGSVTYFTLIMVVASVFIGVLVWFLLSLFLSIQFNPLKTLDQRASDAGSGDLTVSIPVKRNDEIGGISKVFNRFIDDLKSVIINIKGAVDENGRIEKQVIESVQSSSRQIEEVIHGTGVLVELMEKLNEQVDSSRDAVSSIGDDIKGLHELIETHAGGVNKSSEEIIDMTKSIETVAAITGKEIEQASVLKETAHEGGKGLKKTNEAINEITNYVDDIAGFINMIQAIASQTNLLSMNAAIEAAHAGDAGRGFAVVADEIRKLANQSSVNAKRISSVVKGILTTIKSASDIGKHTSDGFNNILTRVDTLVDSLQTIFEKNKDLENSCVQVRNSTINLGDAVGKIRDKTDHTLQQSDLINKSLKILTKVSGEVSVLIIQIDNNSESSDKLMKEINSSAIDMRNAMTKLRTSIERFKTEK